MGLATRARPLHLASWYQGDPVVLLDVPVPFQETSRCVLAAYRLLIDLQYVPVSLVWTVMKLAVFL